MDEITDSEMRNTDRLTTEYDRSNKPEVRGVDKSGGSSAAVVTFFPWNPTAPICLTEQ